MKLRNSFVSNSSSTSFIIKNKTNKTKTLADFVEENQKLIKDFINEYHDFDMDYNTLVSAVKFEAKTTEHYVFEPQVTYEMVFGDEDGTYIGTIFDYILRGGGKSDSFEWEFNEMLR